MSYIKSFIIIAIIVVSPIFLNAQCKVITDDFTNKSVRTATVFITPVNPVYSNVLSFTKDDSSTKISYTLMYQSINRDLKIQDCSILLKLSNGEVLKFTPDAKSKISIIEGNSPSQVIFLSSDISFDQLSLLKQNLIQSVRLAFSGTDGFTVPSIKASKFQEVQKAAACIIK